MADGEDVEQVGLLGWGGVEEGSGVHGEECTDFGRGVKGNLLRISKNRAGQCVAARG